MVVFDFMYDLYVIQIVTNIDNIMLSYYNKALFVQYIFIFL